MQCLAEPHDVQANRIFQMKRTTIVGNIGRDAVCREGDGGHKFVSFSVAYAERKTNETDEQGNPVTVAQWAECEIRRPGKFGRGASEIADQRALYLCRSLGQGGGMDRQGQSVAFEDSLSDH